MIKNYFKIAFRNLWKDNSYSLLNILGLTIGITFSLFLIFYVLDELSYDRYNKKADRIYRVASYVQESEGTMNTASTQFPLAPVLGEDYPEIEQAVRLVNADGLLYKKGDKQFDEDRIYYADKNLFDVFTYPFIEGSPEVALVAPNSMVLTKTMAKRYFGKEKNILGESLENSRGEVFKITGVIKDIPRNSHLIATAFISSSTLPKDFSNSWGMFGNNYTYLLLRPNTNVKALEKKMLPLYDKFMASIFEQHHVKIHYGLMPLTSIHLHSDLDGEPEEIGSMSYIYIFSIVAFFMLLIASINYMNLTTARAARRGKEIGIRKVAGSVRSQLIAQFLMESVVITVISLVLSLGLVMLLLPYFNLISGKFLSIGTVFQPDVIMILVGIVCLVGILGGSYPAFYLTKFNPVEVLKGNLSKASGNIVLRKVLVTTQFSISMIMLICTWVVFDQLQFMKDKDLGFNEDQVLTMAIDPMENASGKMMALKNEIRKNPKVMAVSIADATPGQGTNFNLMSIETKDGFVDKGVDMYGIDGDYFNTLGMQMETGRNFSSATPADTINSMIVNETLVRTFGWQNPIGKKIKFAGDPSETEFEVVGVVKDFHQQSLYNPISPLILTYRPNGSNLQAKISAEDIPSTLATLEAAWKAVFPNVPFQYTFLDKEFNSQYAADQKRGEIFTAFSVLTILISCLGLLGLVAFTTEQRQKEISIRKIVGADLFNLVKLIAKGFMVLVAISCLLAFPIAYLFMHQWLDVFPYKTDIKISTFLISACVILLITLITVLFHTVKAALANPVKCLRTE
ncbi:ABC transporter permease [Flavobacteriaceae bacterium F89]|uniref:ABC transporter permease n=1 Tax=Cerina litoralis TaxID=2874477 RepID=A0AAE3EUQ8_9FLAO|nr:ABC transporter permease [Cerina litoralis]MCG2460091.1 ABC transporter permease [Cerina litoralis]